MEKKKFRAIFILLAVLLTLTILCGPSIVAEKNGPAPDSGDGVPDGSGLESPFGSQSGRGPAPNAGDGVPDGSGWE